MPNPNSTYAPLPNGGYHYPKRVTCPSCARTFISLIPDGTAATEWAAKHPCPVCGIISDGVGSWTSQNEPVDIYSLEPMKFGSE